MNFLGPKFINLLVQRGRLHSAIGLTGYAIVIGVEWLTIAGFASVDWSCASSSRRVTVGIVNRQVSAARRGVDSNGDESSSQGACNDPRRELLATTSSFTLPSTE
jgi:hypothetical protein